eukprot:737700_1
MESSASTEPDYMSDAFLVEAASESTNLGSRLGEGRRKAKKSKLKRPKDPPPKRKKLTQRMHEARVSGLAKPIPESNIGHKLLAKMGYKSGSGLGKDKQGKAAPVGINVKTGKGGVGRARKKTVISKPRARPVHLGPEVRVRSEQNMRAIGRAAGWGGVSGAVGGG